MIKLGDVVSVLREYPDNTFDGVLCDPPYGLSFMGKRWDYDVPSVDLWREVLRVCKPGAPLLAAFGSRTYHRGVVRIEDAGWEIRDSIVWMYGSGFPKSLDVSKAIDAHELHGKSNSAGIRRVNDTQEVASRSNGVLGLRAAGILHGYKTEATLARETVPITAPATDAARLWSGYGTALKPAHEPYVLARKPLEGTVAANVARWGVGALAIDACRVAGPGERVVDRSMVAGRWPANVILDEDAGAALDEQSGNRPGMSSGGKGRRDASMFGVGGVTKPETIRGDSGGASRFFYCAKASRSERDAGCGDLPAKTRAEATGRDEDTAGTKSPRAGAGSIGGSRNHHPTVKPLALCEYLARLILPPKPGVLLVPFAGSGSEVIGALRAGWPEVVGIEREAEYVEIARRRVAHALATPAPKPKQAKSAKPRRPRAPKTNPKPLVVVRRLEQIPLFP